MALARIIDESGLRKERTGTDTLAPTGAHHWKRLSRRIGQQIVDTAVLNEKEKRTVKLLV